MSKRSKTAVWLPIVATLLFCVLAILSGRLQKQEAIGNVVSEQMTFPNGTGVSLSAGDAYGLMESEGPGSTFRRENTAFTGWRKTTATRCCTSSATTARPSSQAPLCCLRAKGKAILS
ncbi:MAG: hypothetical protein ACLTV6_03515 [Christensenellales bacterium]